MQKRMVLACTLLVAWGIGPASYSATAPDASANGAQSRTAFRHELPPMNGAHLKVIVEEVTYPPGGFSKPHSHPCPVVGYVLKGAVRMQVSGSAEAIYRPGDTFFEAPNTQHVVSANASETEAATFLVYFLCDHETPLTIGLPGTGDNGGRK